VRPALEALFARLPFESPFRVVLPDGGELRHGSGAPEFTLRFLTEAALADCINRPGRGLADAYERGELHVDGALARLGDVAAALQRSRASLSPMARLRMRLGNRSSRAGERDAAARGDLGPDFYGLWLDDGLNDSCAYFEDTSDSLETAQRRKLDLVCRKLRLEPGMTVVDAASGWGALAVHAARYYGAHVRGYTVSERQHAYSVERARELGLDNRVEFVRDDYRRIPRDGARYDRFVSVGMFQHVPRSQLPSFVRVVHRAVRPGGLSLLHTVDGTVPQSPGAEAMASLRLPSLADLVGGLQRLSDTLHVVDVENLRMHYALTLEHWFDRFVKHRERIRALCGERITRRYELYLACGPTWFRHDGVMLYQVLVAHGLEPAPPLTRRHMLALDPAY